MPNELEGTILEPMLNKPRAYGKHEASILEQLLMNDHPEDAKNPLRGGLALQASEPAVEPIQAP